MCSTSDFFNNNYCCHNLFILSPGKKINFFFCFWIESYWIDATWGETPYSEMKWVLEIWIVPNWEVILCVDAASFYLWVNLWTKLKKNLAQDRIWYWCITLHPAIVSAVIYSHWWFRNFWNIWISKTILWRLRTKSVLISLSICCQNMCDIVNKFRPHWVIIA